MVTTTPGIPCSPSPKRYLSSILVLDSLKKKNVCSYSGGPSEQPVGIYVSNPDSWDT